MCASTAMLHEELKTEIFLCASGAGKTIWKDFARPDGVDCCTGDQFLPRNIMREAVAIIQAGKSDLQKKLSVELHDLTGYPPTYAYANLDDGCVPASNTTRLDAALTKAGVKHLCETFPTGDHGIGLDMLLRPKHGANICFVFSTKLYKKNPVNMGREMR